MQSDWERYTRTRTTRRRFMGAGVAAGAGAAGLALVGCGDGGPAKQTATPAASSTGAASEPITRGGTLRLPLSGIFSRNPNSLNPFLNGGYFTQTPASLHYSRLLRTVSGPNIAVDDRTVVEGDLAASFEQVDPLTYRFTLKSNAKWHAKAPLNGRAVTATDVAKSYEAFAAVAAPFFKQFSNVIEQVQAPDERTVTIRLKAPYVPFLATKVASNWGPWAVPVETIASGQVVKDPVGSGPYIFREFLPGKLIKWDRNPEYYDAPLPNFDKVEGGLVGDAYLLVAALQTGELDMSGLGGAIFKDVRGRLDPSGQDIFPQTSPPAGLHFNFDNKPFQDKRVRQAMSMILDRAGFLRVQDGTGRGSWHAHVSPGLAPFYLNPEGPNFGPNAKYYRQDIAEAKKLLSAAGAEGLKFRLISTFNIYGPEAKQAWELIAASLQEGGLQPELVFQNYPEPYLSTTFLGKMPADACAMGPFVDTPSDPDDIFSSSYWSNSATKNWGGTPIPEQASIDADIVKQRTIFDKNERVAFIQEMQRKMAESMLTVPYHATSGYVYAQPWLKNYFHKASYTYLPDGLMKANFTADRINKRG